MELLGTLCELSLPGRWGRPNRQDVTIRDCFQANEGRSYLLVQSVTNALDGEYFLLTNRDDKDHIDQLQPRQAMIVAVGKNKEGFNFTEFTHHHTTQEHFFFFGTGLVQIIDEELDAFRKKEAQKSGGVFGPLQDWFERMTGLGRSNR